MANRGRAWTTRVQLLAENGIFSLPPYPDRFWDPLSLKTLCLGAVCLEIKKVETETNQSTKPSADIEYVDL